MASLFHIDTGAVDLGNENFLKSGLSIRQVEELGIPFIRDYHAGAGWQIKSLRPVQVGENVTYLTLTFHQDHLTKLAISLLEQEQDAKLMAGKVCSIPEAGAWGTSDHFAWRLNCDIPIRLGSDLVDIRSPER